MGEPTYSFRPSLFRGELTYRLREGTLRRTGGAKELKLPLAEIRKIRTYESPGATRNGVQLAPPAARCVLWPKRGRAIVLISNHFLGLARFENRSASFDPFVKALVQQTAAANPDAQFIEGMPTALWITWILIMVGLAAALPFVALVLILTALDGIGTVGQFAVGVLALAGAAYLFYRRLPFLQLMRPRRFHPLATGA